MLAMVAFLLCWFTNASGAELAFHNNGIYAQAQPDAMIYQHPLVVGTYQFDTNPTSWSARDISGDGVGPSCRITPGNLFCGFLGRFNVNNTWVRVDSGYGFVVLRNATSADAYMPLHGFMSLPAMSQVDFTEAMMCGVLSGGEVRCWSNTGVDVSFPAVSNVVKVELSRSGLNSYYALILYNDGTAQQYDFTNNVFSQGILGVEDVSAFVSVGCVSLIDGHVVCDDMSIPVEHWGAYQEYTGGAPHIWVTRDNSGSVFLVTLDGLALNVIELPQF